MKVFLEHIQVIVIISNFLTSQHTVPARKKYFYIIHNVGQLPKHRRSKVKKCLIQKVIWEEKKAKVMPSLADMVKEHDAHKKEQESLFNKRSEVQKDRSRILEEKFKEAQKNVDKSKDIPLRDIDLD